MTELPALLERAWGVLSRWGVPVMMTLAYALLVATSEADATGEAWMAAGLVLVMTAWFVFRRLTAAAALSRALSVGDTATLLAIADRELPRRRRPAARARFLVARGFAQLLRGEHAAALATLREPHGAASEDPMRTLIDVLAQIELDRGEDVLDAASRGMHTPRTPWLSGLVRGAVSWYRGDLDGAREPLARVVDDIRAGSALRAIAHVYAARVASARGDTAAAARDLGAARELAVPDATWLRGSVETSRPPARA